MGILFLSHRTYLGNFFLICCLLVINLECFSTKVDDIDKFIENETSIYSDVYDQMLNDPSISFRIEGSYPYEIDDIYIADYLKDKAIENFDEGNYSDAAKLFSNSLLFYEKADNIELQAFVSNFLGTAYRKLGNYASSLECYTNALSIYEKLDDNHGIANVTNNIGVFYKTTGDLQKALEYAKSTLEMTQRIGHERGIGAAYANIAIVYNEREQFDKALEFHKKALTVYESIEFERGIGITLNNISSVLLELEEYEKSLDYSFKAFDLNSKIGATYTATLNVLNIASAYKRQEKFAKARIWAEKGMNSAKKMKVPDLIMNAYELIMEINMGMNDYESAFESQKQYFFIKDSLNNIKTEEKLSELKLKYQTKQSESRIKSQKNKIYEQSLEINKRNLVISIIIGFLLLFLVVFSILFFKVKIKQQKKLSEIYINEEKKRSQDTIAAVEKERKRIARDLHDNLGQKLAYVRIKLDKFSKKSDLQNVEIANLVSDVDDIYRQTRDLSHQMIPKTLLYLGLKPAINDILDQTFYNTKITYGFESNVNDRFDQDVEITLYRILQELISNILKHSAASSVEVSLLETSEQIILIVDDNGIGFDLNSEDQKGIGFLNIESRIKLYNGSMEVNSEINKGTSVIIRLPI